MHLYSAFLSYQTKRFTICLSFDQSHTHIHTQIGVELQDAGLLIESNLGFSVLLKDTLTCRQEELVIEAPTL